MTTDGRDDSARTAGPPLGRLVEVVVFAPIGLAVTIVQGQRMAMEQAGRLVVSAGRAGCAAAAEGVRRVREEVEEQVRADRERSARPTRQRAGSPDPDRRAMPAMADDDDERGGPDRRSPDGAGVSAERAPAAASSSDLTEARTFGDVDVMAPDVAASDLALPDYDRLPASQIVAMLDDLVPAERDDIERYERANRGRRTVLGKLDQLRQAQ